MRLGARRATGLLLGLLAWTTVAAPAVSSATVSYSTTVLGDGPTSYWRLGERSGKTLADAAGTNPGTANGGLTLGIAGALAGDPDTAVGLGSSSAYVSVPNAANLDFGGDFSVEAWAKPNVINGIGRAVVHKGAKTGGNSSWQYRLSVTSANQWRGTVFVGNSAITVTAPGSATTAWTHLVMTKAGTTLRLYVNGVQVASATVNGTVNTSTGILAIGRTGSSSTDYFDGAVDEVAVYPAALSASRVAAHFAAASGPPPPPPTAAFSANLTSGPAPLAVTFTDQSTGSPTAWSWTFGDGATSTVQSPSHTYAAAGTYDVTLTASNAGGPNSLTKTGYITVSGPPPLGFQGPSYSGAPYSPTSDKPQSKLWWNDGSWWADMYDRVSAKWHIFRLDRPTETWIDTGVVIDDRSVTLADVLWDGTHLYAASHVVTISSDSSSVASVPNSPARLYRSAIHRPARRTRSIGLPGDDHHVVEQIADDR